ncbi:10225_t:CDS:2 [Scutellospora calospora]|uniref:10225_t:CDS:1 n=1 Tax=Scutellospora calospora TaxID=85575 RepID=A0ACA9KBP1_9GLOM|nr:10225_t:CDS:2 [Scutellospora calospora]
MKPNETIITDDISNYNLKKLTEIERYVCSDNIEYSVQASIKNVSKENNDNETLAYQINVDLENYDSDTLATTNSKVIKKEIKSNCTLCELVDHIDQCLNAETQWNKFHQYKNSIMFATTSTTDNDLFSIVTKNIDKYLTEAVSSIIKDEITQCLFLTANIIELTLDEFNSEQEVEEEISCRFLEDNYDACKITLNAIIDEVRRENIKEI